MFAAHALCLTWGLEIALGVRPARRRRGRQFGLVETRVGLTPSMGGTQRLAERAGPARAREFVMTGDLYAASTLERWGVVNRVWPDAEFERAPARSRSNWPRGRRWPTPPPSAIIRAAQKEGGARAGDAIVPEAAGGLFATEDLRNAVKSFLSRGPGKATFEGR